MLLKPTSLETFPVDYAFFAMLHALPQIAGAALIPPVAIVAVVYLLKLTQPRPGAPVGID